MLVVLRDRLDPYLSLRAFSLTLAALVGLAVVGSGIAMMTASHPELALSVTVPLGDKATPANPQADEPVAVGTLNPADMATPEPATAPTEVKPPEPAPKPPIEETIEGLHQNTPFGLVPVVRKTDGMTAYKAYRAEFTPAASTKALISLVMVDFGLSKKISEQAIKDLPSGVTLALSPYSPDAQKLTTTARQDGHEVWLGLPVQNEDFGNSDSGNQTLLVNASVDQNKSRLLSTLGKATGYVGVIDMDTPAFANNAADLDRIYSNVLERGLALAQANPKDTLTGEFAITNKAPFIQNDIWIDRNATPAAVAFELDKLKQIASNGRIAVGFFHPYPTVIAAIKDWQDNLARASIEIAPLSSSIDQK